MKIQDWFPRGRTNNRAITGAIYEQIVAAARQPELYAEWGVPDTPLGRFEMIGLHLFLFLHRVRNSTGALAELAQSVTDAFFEDVDSSVRELGIGDSGVPKRVKRLAKMFYGRVMAYGGALEAGDELMLSGALARNVRPDLADWNGAAPLAAYVRQAHAMILEQSDTAIAAGRMRFPEAGVERTQG